MFVQTNDNNVEAEANDIICRQTDVILLAAAFFLFFFFF